MSLFKLRGKLTRTQEILLGILGLVFFIFLWWVLAELLAQKRALVDMDTRLPSTVTEDSTLAQIDLDSLARADSIKLANATEFEKVYPLLPTPWMVVRSFPDLYQRDELVKNTVRSVWLNLQGYFWAVLIAVPVGFLIGLLPMFRGLFSKQVDALRYLPLTALTGLFIVWFGVEDEMKIAFLAFGILVYLLPVVVQRIDEVDDVYLMTVFTLKANAWNTLRSVYLPAVLSRLMDDIRVLTAISWTYIIIAELLNRTSGGIGALIYVKARQGQVEKVFALLIIIILIGFIQDRLFVYLDKRFFPHKYYKTALKGIKEVEAGLGIILGMMTLAIFLGIFWPAAAAAAGSFVWIVVIAALLIVVYGEFTLQRFFAKVKD